MDESTLANDPGADLSRLTRAASEALTDSMVERLATTGVNALEVVDRLNEEDTRDAVLACLDGLTEMHRVGSLNTLFDLIAVLHGARAALTDSMVERLFGLVEQTIGCVSNEEVAAIARNAKEAMDGAATESAGKPATGGMFATLSMLGKPENQQALQFLLAFACNMQRLSKEDAGS